MAASVVLRTARCIGIVPTLRDLALQDFDEPWELIFVDAHYGATDELVSELWRGFGNQAKLRHMPPLKPPFGVSRNCWDILLYINTGWKEAQGEVVVHIEENLLVRPSWLRNFVTYVRANPTHVAVGTVFKVDGEWKPYVDDNPGHCSYKPQSENQHNTDTQVLLPGNMALARRAILAMPTWPEQPTMWPETPMKQAMLAVGLECYSMEGSPAWHVSHHKVVAEYVIDLNCYGGPIYEPIHQTNELGQIRERTRSDGGRRK